MISVKLVREVWGFALVLLVTACATMHEPAAESGHGLKSAQGTANPDTLSPAEIELAVDLLRSSERAAEVFSTERPIYVVDVELIRSKEVENRRMALVTQYRYEGNMAVRSLVDLTARRVMEVEATPGDPVPFAEEELARARELALGDEQLRFVMQEDITGFTSERAGYEVQGLGVRSASSEDPLYGHRVVSLLFETPNGYVTGVEVLVDLTTETVQVSRTGDYR